MATSFLSRIPGRPQSGLFLSLAFLLLALSLTIALAVTVIAQPALAQQAGTAEGAPAGPAANTADSADATGPEAGPAASVAYAASITAEGATTGLTIDFDGRPDYQIFFMDRPMRLVIELDGASYALEGGQLQPGGLVSSVRYGQVSQDKARLVATLSEPAMVSAKQLAELSARGRHRLTLDLAPATAGEYAAMMRNQQALLGASGQVVVKGPRPGTSRQRQEGRFVVVVDPGHGGIDGGATGKHGTIEKDLTLAISRLIGEQIEAAGPFDVHYTRDSDIFVSLRTRRDIARSHNADLLISIHADSLRQNYVRGTTIYTLAKRASDSLAQEIAESENLADVVAGLAAPDEQDAVSGILADLTLRETTIFSRNFSDRLVVRLADRVNLINNPQRSASFTVLKNAEIPGVLLELGYLSNEEDEKLMKDPQWQETMALHVAEAVADFFGPRLPADGASEPGTAPQQGSNRGGGSTGGSASIASD